MLPGVKAVRATKTRQAVPGTRAVTVTFDFWVQEQAGGPKVYIDYKGSSRVVSKEFRLRLRFFRHFYPDIEVRVIDHQGNLLKI